MKDKFRNKIEELISQRLEKTKDCDFKRAWIPKGWTCVKNEIFTKELGAQIEELFLAHIRKILERKND